MFKIVVLMCLPVPLIILPVVGIVGSFLGGIGYGFFAPLLATFELVGENVQDKFYHCFIVSETFWFLLMYPLDLKCLENFATMTV